jgi:hypothetical protein
MFSGAMNSRRRTSSIGSSPASRDVVAPARSVTAPPSVGKAQDASNGFLNRFLILEETSRAEEKGHTALER